MSHTKRFLALLWDEVGKKVIAAIAIIVGLFGPAAGIGWGIARLWEKPFAPAAGLLTLIGLVVWLTILFLLMLCLGAFFWLIEKWEDTREVKP